jgi:outer membrane protein assembly factor BamB
LTVDLKTKARTTLGTLFLGSFLPIACAPARILPPTSPFPPKSRWEKPLDVPLSGPLATDGTLVFASLSDGSVWALDPLDGHIAWTRPGLKPGLVVARKDLLVVVEKGGVAWGIKTEDGAAQWKTTTSVSEVRSIRLDGNRVFIGGASGLAAVLVSTGQLRFDLPAADVRDIEVAGETLAAIEAGALMVRNREDGAIRFRLASPEGEFGAPAVFADGRIVLGSGTRLVRAVSAGGGFKWRFKVGARVRDRPLDYLDRKRVGVFSFEGVFYELSLPGGDMRGRALMSSRPFGPPTLAAGRIWAPILEDEIAVIDPRTAKLIGRARFGGSFLSPPILAAGRLLAEVSGPRRIVALEILPSP